MEELLDFLFQYPIVTLVLTILGSLVVFASAIVALTPSKSDDAWLAKVKAMPVVGAVIVFLERFSVVARK